VLDVTEVEYIKRLYEHDGLSLREIVRRTRKDFRTVRKYAFCDDFNQPELPRIEPESYPAVGKHIPVIDEWLAQDTREPRKQRHTAQRMYDRLKAEHGYAGSYSSVRRYVQQKKQRMAQAREGFLPMGSPPAHAQVDFGEFKYYDALGGSQKGHALILSFPCSNAAWMQVFQAENQECLLTGMKRIFYHIDGVPVRLRCDNMSTAVVQIRKGSERVVTDGFSRFMLHHRFIASFCNPGKGNEKGNVENKVGYTRRALRRAINRKIPKEFFGKGGDAKR
jgi:transposase